VPVTTPMTRMIGQEAPISRAIKTPAAEVL
jgi:hypothetical protein